MKAIGNTTVLSLQETKQLPIIFSKSKSVKSPISMVFAGRNFLAIKTIITWTCQPEKNGFQSIRKGTMENWNNQKWRTFASNKTRKFSKKQQLDLSENKYCEKTEKMNKQMKSGYFEKMKCEPTLVCVLCGNYSIEKQIFRSLSRFKRNIWELSGEGMTSDLSNFSSSINGNIGKKEL